MGSRRLRRFSQHSGGRYIRISACPGEFCADYADKLKQSVGYLRNPRIQIRDITNSSVTPTGSLTNLRNLREPYATQ